MGAYSSYGMACQGRLPYLLVFELHRSGCRCSVGGLQYFRLLVRGDAMIPGSGYAVPAISVTSSRFQQEAIQCAYAWQRASYGDATYWRLYHKELEPNDRGFDGSPNLYPPEAIFVSRSTGAASLAGWCPGI